MSKPKTLAAAMTAGDELAEAEIRYRLLAETFEEMPQLRANLNSQMERVKTEILRLRAAEKPAETEGLKVVAFDQARFRKSGA